MFLVMSDGYAEASVGQTSVEAPIVEETTKPEKTTTKTIVHNGLAELKRSLKINVMVKNVQKMRDDAQWNEEKTAKLKTRLEKLFAQIDTILNKATLKEVDRVMREGVRDALTAYTATFETASVDWSEGNWEGVAVSSSNDTDSSNGTDWSTAGTSPSTMTDVLETTLSVKVFLQGPYDAGTSMMKDTLRTLWYIPTKEPYSGLWFKMTGGKGVAMTTPVQLDVIWSSAIVDRVLVELRDSFDKTNIVQSIPWLVLRNGTVVWADGTSLKVKDIAVGEYYVMIRHRNHLPVMTDRAISFDSKEPVTLDFTNGSTPMYWSNGQKIINGVYVMWAWDVNNDDKIVYSGPQSDADAILNFVGASTPNAQVAGYYREDVNMDGNCKYNGSSNDRNSILGNVWLSTPTNVINVQF